MKRVTGVPVAGPLAPYAKGFQEELRRLGYTPRATAGQLWLMAHLSSWLAGEGLDASALTPTMVDAFLTGRRAAGCVSGRTARSLRPLVDHLRRLGVAPPSVPIVPAAPAELLLGRYRDYLIAERGLADTTAALYVRMVRPFLLDRVQASVDGRLDLEHLAAGDVTGFVVAQGQRRPRSVKFVVSALRSLLGFLHADGIVATPLATAIPSVAGWAPAGLPRALEADQVTALLASCDRDTPTGRRNLAVLRLLARLGLRAGEVAALTLDDIDWPRGEITMCGKANRRDRLPLPVDVGQAIVGYLQFGRPNTAQGRTVFVRAHAPHQALTSTGVTTIVAVEARRAGLGLLGAHRLRHSAATAMLRSGGSLQEIGQVLRHRNLLTTALYANVDLLALRQLVRAWPGDAA